MDGASRESGRAGKRKEEIGRLSLSKRSYSLNKPKDRSVKVEWNSSEIVVIMVEALSFLMILIMMCVSYALY